MIEAASMAECNTFIHDALANNVSHTFAVDSPDFPISIKRGLVATRLSARYCSHEIQEYERIMGAKKKEVP